MKKKYIILFLLGWSVSSFLYAGDLISLPHAKENWQEEQVHEQTATLQMRDLNYTQALKKVAQTFSVGLAVNSSLVPEGKVDLRMEEVTLRKALDLVLEGTGVDAFVSPEGNIILRKSNEQQVPKKQNIKGKVTSESGEPLIGATVVIKQHLGIGTVTDLNGKFSISVPDDAQTLVFSYIGYLSLEVTIGNRTELNISLKSDSEALDEVVVVGYGKKSSKNVSGSITSLSPNDFNKGPVTNIQQMLQGKAACVYVSKDGDPNGTGSIVIRGTSTLREDGQSPLYVIDGVPYSSNLVVPQDIVSIDILKDASAAAIYGSRAANGVILITTRQGQTKESSYVNFDSYINIDEVSNRYEMMTGDQYRKYLTDNGSAPETGWDDGVNKDWQKEIMRTAISQNYYLNLGGSSESTKYDGSINYLSQEGIIKTSGQEKIVVRLNVDKSLLNDHLTLGFTANSTIAKHDLLASPAYVYRSMLTFVPTVNAKDENGNYKEDITRRDPNPIALINQNHKDSKDEIIFGSLRAAYTDIIDGLDYNLMLSYNNNRVGNNIYLEKESVSDQGKNGSATRNTYESNSLIFENYFSYDKKINKHQIGGILGYSWQEDNTNDGFQSSNINFISDATEYYNLGLGSTPDGYLVDYGSVTMRTLRMISFYGRLSYNYDQRYILQASLRNDGSSAFGKNEQWGLFPSISGAWRIISEDFMSNQHFFNDLKLKAGYGVSGNSLGFDPLVAQLRYGNVGKFYYQGSYINAIGPVQNENDDLKWEKTEMLNVGLDIAFLQSRLKISMEYYNKLTSDLIWNYSVSPTEYLYETLTANVGKVRNKGFEATISATPVKTADFSWNTSLILAHNKNEVESLSNDKFKIDYVLTATSVAGAGQSGGSAQIIKEGYPLGTFYTLDFEGFNENGESLFLDKDGNITESPVAPDDYYIKGNAQPKLNFSWSNNLSYKNLTLDFMFSGVLGHKVLNATLAQLNYTSRVSHYNMPQYVIDSKQPFNDIRSHFISDRYIEKADYLRLQNLTLNYQFNINKKDIKNLSVYFSVNNVFVLTNYKGIDPEINMGGIQPGIDHNNLYPQTRSFQLGLRVRL